MDMWIQWAVGLVGGAILGYLGRYYIERHAREVEARQDTLGPVEDWIQSVMRLTSIIGDELSSISLGLPLPMRYGLDDRSKVAEELSENKPRVLGILESKALNTRRTRKHARDLAQTINDLSVRVEMQYLQAYYQLFDKLDAKQDASAEMRLVLGITVSVRESVQNAHKLIADLKTKLT